MLTNTSRADCNDRRSPNLRKQCEQTRQAHVRVQRSALSSWLLTTVSLLLLCSCFCQSNKLFYKTFYLSEGCLPDHKPVFVQLMPDDSNCALVIRSTPSARPCAHPIRNCSIYLIAPTGFGFSVTPEKVRIQHNVMQLRMHLLHVNNSEPRVDTIYRWPQLNWPDPKLDEQMQITLQQGGSGSSDVSSRNAVSSGDGSSGSLHWKQVRTNESADADTAELDMDEYIVDIDKLAPNQSISRPVFSATGPTQLLLTVNSFQKASSWRSVDLQLVITLVSPLNEALECAAGSSFFWNCGNQICVRQSLKCDGVNNCANNADEQNCGFQMAEIFILGVFLVLVIIFMLIVFYVYIRLLRKQRPTAVPRIKINSIEEKSESQSI